MKKKEITIDRTSVEEVTEKYKGNKIFKQKLNAINDLPKSEKSERFLSLLGNYIQFNEAFGSGVATLAGNIASMFHTFKDPDEECDAIADRSIHIASDIFYAAIDEFGGSSMHHRITHRAMAQAVIKHTGEYYGFSPKEVNGILVNNPTAPLMFGTDVKKYYSYDVFLAIGFHIGSEILASFEFNILNTYMETYTPDLVKYLKSKDVYRWIKIHTAVEEDHFNIALRAANNAIKYDAPNINPDHIYDFKMNTLRGNILEGVAGFAELQERFMKAL